MKHLVTVSEVIDKLNVIKDAFGDLPCVIQIGSTDSFKPIKSILPIYGLLDESKKDLKTVVISSINYN